MKEKMYISAFYKIYLFFKFNKIAYLNIAFTNIYLLNFSVKETGSWDKGKDHGLSYECRTLLFKALHNLIER